jgi:hypothetical protein
MNSDVLSAIVAMSGALERIYLDIQTLWNSTIKLHVMSMARRTGTLLTAILYEKNTKLSTNMESLNLRIMMSQLLTDTRPSAGAVVRDSVQSPRVRGRNGGMRGEGRGAAGERVEKRRKKEASHKQDSFKGNGKEQAVESRKRQCSEEGSEAEEQQCEEGAGGSSGSGKAAPRKRAKRPHNRQRSQCKHCGGASICEHIRLKSQCKHCGGASICEARTTAKAATASNAAAQASASTTA